MSWDVFDFENFGDLVDAFFRSPPGRKRPYSLAELSKKLGYSSPRLFGMVLKGQRAPSRRLLDSLARILKWDRARRDYVELLVAKLGEEKESNAHRALQTRIQHEQNNRVRPYLLDESTEKVLSEWYFVAIKSLVATKSFREDGAWIARRLRGKVSADEALRALRLLEEVGFLARDESKRLVLSKERIRLVNQPDRQMMVGRRFQAQMMQRAVDALNEIPPEGREIVSLTMRFSPEDTVKAKAEIRTFVETFSAKYYAGQGDEIFQLNLQLFPLSTPGS